MIHHSKKTLILISLVVLMVSCGTRDIESESVLSQSEVIKSAESLLKLNKRADSINKSRNISKVDSSKFVRAFEDIYFGAETVGSKSIYYLNNIPYKIGTVVYSTDYGLYRFQLLAQNAYFQSTYPSIKDEIIKVISLKYSSGKKHYDKIDGVADRAFARIGSNDDGASQPNDWYDIIYLHKWEKNGILIKLGYQVDYDEKVDSKALFRPVLSFLYLPYLEKTEKKADAIIKGESNKF